jgi:hypothetical protein
MKGKRVKSRSFRFFFWMAEWEKELAACKKILVFGGGKLYVKSVSSQYSEGFLELEPGAETVKHRFSFPEKLVQERGKTVVKIFYDNAGVGRLELFEGEGMLLSSNQFHLHANPFPEKCVTRWQCRGTVQVFLENANKE